MKRIALHCLLLALLVHLLGRDARCQSAGEPEELAKVRASYQQQIKVATDPIKTKYAEYLEGLKKAYGAKGDVAAASAIQKEIDSLGIVIAPPIGAKADKIVIWNQNNGGKGDRGTKKVNLILSFGGREVYRKSGIKLKWDAGVQTKEEVDVPTLNVDKIRVEVTELVNNRGGLGEIEYFKAGKNVALGNTVVVSGVWETNPKHTGVALTDGTPETYWLLNDKQEGWAEITLK